MKITERMSHPEDVLTQRTASNLGEILHEYYKLPGEYLRPANNEFYDSEGNKLRVNGVYYAIENGKEFIVNIEDKSSIDNKTLKETLITNTAIRIAEEADVLSVISTSLPLKKIPNKDFKYGSLRLIPTIISFGEKDGCKKLTEIERKISCDYDLSSFEVLDLIFLTRMFEEEQLEILEKSCELFSKIRISNPHLRYELARCMECVIHEYAKDLEEINRLVDMIEINKAYKPRDEIIHKAQRIGKLEGRLEERLQGRLEIAQKFARKYDIDEVAEISGFSKDQILNGFASK